MKHLDLFSGIGGFAYAADQVFKDVEHIFCDNDPFCRAVLAKHRPESEIYDDIKAITANSHGLGLEGQELLQQGGQSSWRGDKRPFLLTGGFPCQPYSTAGLRRGTADERHLWPEMFRVIQLTKPTWVIAENVRGLVTWNGGLVLEQVCTDLEAAGYEVQPFIIPAVAVNAPHRRDRIWFVANRTGDRREWGGEGRSTQERHPPRSNEAGKLSGGSKRSDSDATDTERSRPQDRLSGSQQEKRSEERRDGYSGPDWGQDWPEVAAELCGVDDGLPARVGDFALTRAGHRAAQIKAYGNAIVPQVAMEIMKAIKLTKEAK